MNLRAFAIFILFTVVLSFSGQAHAGGVGFLTWEWSYSTLPGEEGPGPGTTTYVGSGNFITSPTASPTYPYVVTSITGTMNGENITALLTPGTYESNDNLLALPPRQVTVNGISFVTSTGTDYNIFLDYPNYEMDSQDTSPNPGFDIEGSFVATVIPEPSRYGFLIVLTVAGFVGWRKLSRIALI